MCYAQSTHRTRITLSILIYFCRTLQFYTNRPAAHHRKIFMHYTTFSSLNLFYFHWHQNSITKSFYEFFIIGLYNIKSYPRLFTIIGTNPGIPCSLLARRPIRRIEQIHATQKSSIVRQRLTVSTIIPFGCCWELLPVANIRIP